MAKIVERSAGYIKVVGSERSVTVRRFIKADGDSFSGWVAQCDDGANYSDSCLKAEAIRSAKAMADGAYGY